MLQLDIGRLQKMIQSGTIMNMIFYGRPGLGKTSAARIIYSSMHPDRNSEPLILELNGSSCNGIDDVRKNITGFAKSCSWTPFKKICFIDEADYLSGPAQAGLRYLIEEVSGNCRLLFTANKIGKIIDALRSRMKQICFDISPEDRVEVIEVTRYETQLPELGIKFDPKRLREIVGIYYPDLRSIANEIEFEFA